MTIARRPSSRVVILLCAAICLVLLFCAYELKSHQSIEWDEGVYLTTFQSVQHGFPVYQQTYLSQPPGFFVATFPLYSLFGSTLESARLAVFSYSLVGLVGIVWLGWELDAIGFSFIAISVLYAIPIYYVQILTFHSDSLPSSFSVLALASALRYRNLRQWRWLLFSALAVTVAMLIKADVSVLPSIFILLLSQTFVAQRRIREFVKIWAIFSFTILLALVTFTLPFGLNNVFENVVQLRVQAANASSADVNLFAYFLQQEPQLIAVLLAAIVLGALAFWKHKDRRLLLFVLFAWGVTTFLLLLIYHPLFAHHLVLLAVPGALLLSFALYVLISRVTSPRFRTAAVGLLTIIMLVGRTNSSLAKQDPIPTDLEAQAVNLVAAYSQPSDYIVSDDGLVTGLSNRFTPPALTDMSYVRIASGNLTPDEFRDNLLKYKPRLVLTWASKLVYLANFDQILEQAHYTLLDYIDDYHRAYILQPQADAVQVDNAGR